jgi:ribosomal protein S18 acetylase RimI-like enzyme
MPARTNPRAFGLRALVSADIPRVAELSATAFGFDLSDPAIAGFWRRRLEHALTTDPEGCFVAERDGRPIGVAQAIVRERLWILSLLTVDPRVQSAGAGRALLERALAYGTATDAGLIASSSDPRALRLYALAGFTLHPTLQARGSIDVHSRPPVDPEVREAGAEDVAALAGISREVRGAPHTQEIEFALRSGSHLLRLRDRGFAVATPGQGVWLLVARDDDAAVSLLWSALAIVGPAERPIARWITAEQGWAVEVLLRAGLRVEPYGALCVRGDPGPLTPLLPSAPFA